MSEKGEGGFFFADVPVNKGVGGKEAVLLR